MWLLSLTSLPWCTETAFLNKPLFLSFLLSCILPQWCKRNQDNHIFNLQGFRREFYCKSHPRTCVCEVSIFQRLCSRVFTLSLVFRNLSVTSLGRGMGWGCALTFRFRFFWTSEICYLFSHTSLWLTHINHTDWWGSRRCFHTCKYYSLIMSIFPFTLSRLIHASSLPWHSFSSVKILFIF